jgi:hypothetical protein
MRNGPTHSDLAKTAKRLQARQPLVANPAPAVQELKRMPKPGSVVTGLSMMRVIHEKPKARGL